MDLFAKYKHLLPVFVLLVPCSIAIATAARGVINLDAKNYAAFILLAASVLAYFNLRVFYKWVLLVTLIAGTFNLVDFSAVEMQWSLGVERLMIEVQPICLLAALAAVLVGYKQIAAVIFGVAASELLVADSMGGAINMEKIGSFKERYRNFATQELNRIVSENKYAPEELEAARQVLEERAL